MLMSTLLEIYFVILANLDLCFLYIFPWISNRVNNLLSTKTDSDKLNLSRISRNLLTKLVFRLHFYFNIRTEE
jgi:hypothetical protein